jgi:four helix bundle protein
LCEERERGTFTLILVTHSQTHTLGGMFDFQKLEVYNKSKVFNKKINNLMRLSSFDRTTNDQLRRASFSIMLNIAEGSSRFGNRDHKNFIVISRGSAFECVAILDYLLDNQEIERNTYAELYDFLEEISKMLYSLIKRLDK